MGIDGRVQQNDACNVTERSHMQAPNTIHSHAHLHTSRSARRSAGWTRPAIIANTSNGRLSSVGGSAAVRVCELGACVSWVRARVSSADCVHSLMRARARVRVRVRSFACADMPRRGRARTCTRLAARERH